MKRRYFLTRTGLAALATATPFPSLAQKQPLVASRLRGPRNALDYGVVPNSTSDQTAAFQTMLDMAASDGHAVFLPGGSYILTTIRLPSRLLVEGMPGHSQLIHTGNGPLLRAESANSVTLRGLSVDGAGRPANEYEGLIDLREVAGFSIEECTIDAAGANGLYLRGSSGSLEANSISNASHFAVFAVDCGGVVVTKNKIGGCGNGGVVVHRSEPGHDGAVITENRISSTAAASGGTGQWGNAINLFRADDTIVAYNQISGSAFSAIRGNTLRRMMVSGNICRDCGETAIYAEFGFEDAIIADNIIDGAANGISAPNLDHGGHGATISGNIIRNLRMSGPYEPDPPGFGTGISVEADAVVTGNLIDGAPLFGINAGWGSYLRDVSIAANTIRNARHGIGVSTIEGVGSVLIRDNLIEARETGILPHAWGEPTGPDLLSYPEASPVHVAATGNVRA